MSLGAANPMLTLDFGGTIPFSVKKLILTETSWVIQWTFPGRTEPVRVCTGIVAGVVSMFWLGEKFKIEIALGSKRS